MEGERFRPAFNAPMLAGSTCLDFESKDENGKFSAPEASLKSSVFISTNPRRVTVARGASRPKSKRRPVHGVSGMAGVGKTTALIGLGHDEDIHAHFIHGVLYISVGQNAAVGDITTELWKIMTVTGATTSAAAVQASKSLSDAVALAAIWFHGKRILFLVDDIWPTSTSPEGYLSDLEGLLQGSPESRMAISTRSLQIARKGGSHVDFGARDPCGRTSLAIFLAHAIPETSPTNLLLDSSRSVLQLCAGLPISLSVAGAAVALRVDSGDEFEDAVLEYLENIQAQISLYPGTSFLDSAIELSLLALAEYQEKRSHGAHEASMYSISELYISLCVLENQQFAPVPVLARMWGLSDARANDICLLFKSMSLAKISTKTLEGRKQRGLNIHDLHLDFCRRGAIRSGALRSWHERLLDSHMTLSSSLNDGVDNSDESFGLSMLEYTPRPWWADDVVNKDYIRKHVSRHLQGAGLDLELGSTVLDIRWISAQGENGGVQRLLNDLSILEQSVEDKLASREAPFPMVPVKLISETIVGTSSTLPLGIRIAYFEICSLLFSISQKDELLHVFLQRMKEAVPKPFLVPIIHFYRFPVHDRRLDMDVKLPNQDGSAYHSTAFCDRYCAAGSNRDAVVFDLETQARLKVLTGHRQDVNVVSFGLGAHKLVSGSLDGFLFVWDWMAKEKPSLVLKGHKKSVTCLSTREKDSKFCSGSEDGTVRVWDISSGELFDEFSYGDQVTCVSICPTKEVLAVGTSGGRLICREWVSGQCIFQHSLLDKCAISAIQFDVDGKLLVCGSTLGAATAWRCAKWEKMATVNVPGSLTHIAIHDDGLNILLGSSTGEIRHWIVTEEDISKYNVSLGFRINGLSFRKSRGEILVGHERGFVLAWTGPMSNPNLDFSDVRNNMLYDFSISNHGTRAASATQDGMIRIWNCFTGALVVAYDAPSGGVHRLTLSAMGTKIALSTTNGTICVWNAEMPPTANDVSIVVDDDTISCISFSPDESRLLVCVEEEVQVWNLETRQKIQQISSFGSLDASFSSDGRFIIVGNTTRSTIWDVAATETIFDTADQSLSSLSLSEAKHIIKTCCSYAHRMCPFSLRDSGTVSSPLTVDNVFNFMYRNTRPSHFAFSENVFVLRFAGRLIVYRLET